MKRLLLTVLALGACKAGPTYVRPPAPVSATYKEVALFRPSAPADMLDRGPWWRAFADPELDRLEAEALGGNQDVAAQAAALRQAGELVRAQRAGLFPSINATGQYQRSGSFGASNNVIVGPGGVVTGGGGGAQDRFVTGLSASWTPDLFGGVRRGIEQARADGQSAAADLANIRLAVTSELAINYLQLRGADAQRRVLADTVRVRARDLEITTNRYNVGVAAKTDVLQARTQLLTARAQLEEQVRQRGVFEHAVAVLAGRAPAALTVAERATWTPAAPAPPPGVPSALLERRPDIAAAERRAAALSAAIGVQAATLFPNLTLSGNVNQSANSFANLFALGANFYQIGPALAYSVLDFGARRARTRAARAQYEGAVATYRQTVLTALQQVEDGLIGVRQLGAQSALQADNARAAGEAADLTRNQYKAGTADFTVVIVAEANALNARQSAIQAGVNRQVATVQLVQGLGGGWSASELAAAR